MCDYFPATPPSQRVQFLLGREELEDDEDRQAHDMFCEMEELRAVGEDGEKEWKETARFGSLTVIFCSEHVLRFGLRALPLSVELAKSSELKKPVMFTGFLYIE